MSTDGAITGPTSGVGVVSAPTSANPSRRIAFARRGFEVFAVDDGLMSRREPPQPVTVVARGARPNGIR
jgi:hypothetical protein